MRGLICLFATLTLYAQEDPGANREHVRAALKKMHEADKRKADFLYQRRFDKKEFASDGQLKTETILTMRRDPWEEQLITRVIARDDKPLPRAEIDKQEERLRKTVEELRKNPPKPKEEQVWIDELPDALEFHKASTEVFRGRMSEIYEFEPRPGYKAKESKAKAFEKIRGKVWIDQADGEMARLEVAVFDTINVGFGMLGRVEKGTHFEMERKKWEAGFWFDEWNKVRFDLRVMMVKSMRQELENRWSNFSPRPVVRFVRSGS